MSQWLDKHPYMFVVTLAVSSNSFKFNISIIARKHLHNMIATLIDNVELQWYSQCCGNLSAIWENPRKTYQDML